jgi:hypothetical protein
MHTLSIDTAQTPEDTTHVSTDIQLTIELLATTITERKEFHQTTP